MSFQPHDEHPCWAEGYNDGLEDRKANPPIEDETSWHEYMEGYYIGQDAAIADLDEATPKEREEVDRASISKEEPRTLDQG